MIDFKKYPEFEISNTRDNLQIRSFLNDVGFDNGAYVILDQVLNDKFLSTFTLKIADCTKTVTLNFSNIPSEIKNSRAKLNKLKKIIEIAENILEG